MANFQKGAKQGKRGKMLGLPTSYVHSYIWKVVKYPRANFRADSIKTLPLHDEHLKRGKTGQTGQTAGANNCLC